MRFPILLLVAAGLSGLVYLVVAAWSRLLANRRPAGEAAATTMVLPYGTADSATVIPGLAWLRGVKGLDGNYLLAHPVNRVGRSATADVVLDRGTVSRHQCTIEYDGQNWLLVAKPSRNGTFVNATLVAPEQVSPLSNGDSVRIGERIELEVFIPGAGRTVPLRLNSAPASAAGTEGVVAGNHTVVVASGVGDPAAAELAARTVTAGMLLAVAGDQLRPAVASLDAEIRMLATRKPRYAGMAAHLDAAVLEFDGADWWLSGVHVGAGIAMVQTGADEVTTLTTLRAPLRGGPLGGDGAAVQQWRRRAEPGDRYLFVAGDLVRGIGIDELRDSFVAMRGESPEVCAGRLIETAGRLIEKTGRDPAAAGSMVVADVVTSAGVHQRERTVAA